MNACVYQSSCSFHNDLNEIRPAVLKSIKAEYCDNRYSKCARFVLSNTHGPRLVSRYLLPEDIHGACKILDELD